ncbi:hypothetical protein KIW84_076728 [Lathyrus oleraceus]|uniref:Uncharacterized protein n=1 Tax=Pisum sativum TaxID=3888 RepID=A0A9D4W068_PEA|nr:hypothetical protein KIW84_076728 [Pisum sativum]
MEEAQGQVGSFASRSVNGDAETNCSDLDLARSHCGSDNVLMRVKDGKNTSFWFNKLIGNQLLKDVFPELFALAADPTCCVADLGHCLFGVSSWYAQGLGLHQNICDSWLREDLQELLADKTLVLNVVDEFDWLPENDNSFYVKSVHESLLSRSVVVPLSEKV